MSEKLRDLEIVKDVNILHNKSIKVDLETENFKKTLSDLCFCFVPDALGLAAPQIGIFHRMFLAKVMIKGTPTLCVFVNPVVTPRGDHRMKSVESCLSLPNISRCIKRFEDIELSFDKGYEVMGEGELMKELESPMHFRGLDACIIQHETDHLDGILITDHPEVETPAYDFMTRSRLRKKKITLNRQAKAKVNFKARKPEKERINPRKQKKLKKMERARQRKIKKRARQQAEREFLEDQSDA